MPVSYQEVDRFVRATHKGGCGHCSSPRFSVLGNGEEAAEILLQPLRSEGSFKTYAAMCLACGHIHSFLARHVDEWLQKNPDKSGA